MPHLSALLSDVRIVFLLVYVPGELRDILPFLLCGMRLEESTWFWNYYHPAFSNSLKEYVMEAKENFTNTTKIIREG